jgi:carboxyl-terminal processing protease
VSEFQTKQTKTELSTSKKVIILVLVFLGGWLFGAGQMNFKANKSTTQKSLPSNLNYADVERVYDELRSNYDGDLDVNKLMDGLKEGLVAASGDPYTEYMSPDKAKDFSGQLNGTFEGIGAYLGKNDQGNVIVISPVDGFPAEKAGLQPRDVIVAIDGKDSTAYSVDQAVEKIRGPKGTNVKLRVIRNSKEDLSFDIKREQINIPSVESKVINNNIGYIKISRFGDDTSALARKAAEKFKADGVQKVILDLRGNPGGYLDSAVDVSSLWLKDKTVLTERRDGVTIKTYKTRGSAPLLGIPTIVLIDEGSASASEITAGALRDNNAATLIGVKSFGKGSVQQPQNLDNGGILKVTVARWYTPGGKNIDKQGIQPDKKVEISVDDIKAGRDPQLDAAVSQ